MKVFFPIARAARIAIEYFLFLAAVARYELMWSMAGMTVVMLAVFLEKKRVASLKIWKIVITIHGESETDKTPETYL